IDLAAGVKENPKLDFDPYQKYGGVGSATNLEKGYWVVMQHPVTTEVSLSRKQIEETLHAMYEINEPVLMFWPNVDAGADGTSTGIRSFRETHKLDHFHFFKNMEPTDFLRILCNSKGLIGNSSVGIRECAFLGIPVVNIGSRQNRRDRGNNVIDVGYDKTEILAAIKAHSTQAPTASHIYGGGNAGEQIADLLAKLPLRFHKTITF
ncbi:MAG: UDP-N-acetylglucosamine 2-epimerase (hydrolyzing), partial [Mongoliibacter sp.]|uniref:UDP-N-acetylglucosamine 2-epimerase n=1 Tax=Mongoliibacter sp. TaxID=2022438 RepID=UPI0012F0D4EA